MKKILSWVRNRFNIDKLYIVEQSLPLEANNHGLFRKFKETFLIQSLIESDSGLYRRYMEFADGIKKKDVPEWVSDGNQCFLAIHKDEIIGSIWFSTKYYSYDEFRKVRAILKDTAHVCKVFVSPQFRSNGIASCLISHGFRLAENKGLKKVTGVIRFNNRAALRTFHNLGFKITHKLYIFKIGSVRFPYLTAYQTFLQ